MKTKLVFVSFIMVIFSLNMVLAQSTTTRLQASISGKSSGNIKVSEMIGQEIIVNNADYTVTNFTIVIDNGGSVTEIQAAGSVLNKDHSNALRELPAGAKVSFTNIKAKNGQGQISNIPAMKFVIIS